MEKLIYLPIDRLHPHPDNPRKELGDLTELADSIKANGILQNLTVVADDPTNSMTSFTVIIGHRRSAAAKLAGLAEVPCVIAEMTAKEQLQTMLLENMQRSDLTVYEQAQGFQMMLDMGETVESIAKKSGFSQTTVRRRVKMMELDQTVLKDVSERQISLTDFDKLSQIEDIETRNQCLEKIGTADFNQKVTSAMRLQNIKAKLPMVKQQVKEAKAKAIKQSETWSGKYEAIGATLYIYDLDENEDIIPKKVKGQLYYYLDETYGHLRFYSIKEKPAPVKRSAAEIEKEKRLAAAWEQARELSDVAYKLRSEFINGISLNPKNATAMLKGSMVSIIFRSVDYCSPDRTLIMNTLGLDDSSYDPERAEKAYAALGDLSAKGYPLLIYANFGDSANLSYASGYKHEWPKHDREARLDALYDWLCSLGYVMSADEKSLQDGTHQLFDRGEEKQEGDNE